MRLLAPLLALLLAAAPAAATGSVAPAGRDDARRSGYAAPQPIYKLTLSRGQDSAITQPKKIVKAVSGDPSIVEVSRFMKAAPAIALRARGPGVTNVLVWTSDSQVHTYRVTVR